MLLELCDSITGRLQNDRRRAAGINAIVEKQVLSASGAGSGFITAAGIQTCVCQASSMYRIVYRHQLTIEAAHG